MHDIDFIYKRKSIRKFKDDLIPKEHIIELIKAASYAPSPKHQQNWHFVVIEDKDTIDDIAEIVKNRHEEIGSLALNERDFKKHMSVIDYYTSFKNAPVLIVVYCCEYKMIELKILQDNNAPAEVIDMVKSPQSAAQCVGAAVQNILLSAASMGYGGCYMTGPAHAKSQIEERISFKKDGYELMAMVSLGVPSDDVVNQPPRKPLEEIMTFI